MSSSQRHDSIYLASQSPRRQQLLLQLGVAYQLLLPGADEDAESLEAEQRAERPADYVQRVTALKLRAALARLSTRGLAYAPVLCADTTVALGRRILGKPADADQARATLAALSGRSHRVFTAVAIGMPGSRRIQHALSSSLVRFAVLSPAVIEAYVASGDCFGKAGSYAIQSAWAGWVHSMEGSYSGIMGLPLFETAQLLQAARVRTALTP
jgi:septum formation protein